MANWYEMLKEAMEEDGEEFATRYCTMDEEGLKEEFDSGFGSIEGKPFTAWVKTGFTSLSCMMVLNG